MKKRKGGHSMKSGKRVVGSVSRVSELNIYKNLTFFDVVIPVQYIFRYNSMIICNFFFSPLKRVEIIPIYLSTGNVSLFPRCM